MTNRIRLDPQALFNPRGVMLVGASRDPRKPGGAILRNLVAACPAFTIHAVNPHRVDTQGVVWSPSVEAVRDPCDLAVVAVSAERVPGVIAQLGAKGVRVAVVVSAGLSRDNGLAARALAAARDAGLRILGPNCIGLLVPRGGLDASFASGGARKGRLAFVSQSGALVASVLDWAQEREIGFSAVLSVGDMLDVGLDELIRLLAEDDETTAILIYLEGLADARPFLRSVRELAGRKPVIVLKAGRGQAGARAALSHTGALAGAHDVYRAAFRQYGIVMVETLEGLFDAAAVLARAKPLAGDRLGIVTNGGGAGILAIDALASLPGRLADLSSETLDRLDGCLPSTWSRGNPVDIIGDADGARYSGAIEAMLDDPAIDALLVMNCATGLVEGNEIAAAVAKSVRMKQAGKPVLACWLGAANARMAEAEFADAGIALFQTPADAVHGFSVLVQACRGATHPAISGREMEEGKLDQAKRLIADVRADGRHVMSELEAKALLGLFGVPVVPTVKAASAVEVARACTALTPPYVVKIVSPDLTHKSDIGGVALGLSDPAAAQAAAEAMLVRIRTERPEARLEGFSVQPMVARKQAHELFCGIATDPAFGPVLMVGAGGTAVEVLADRAIRLPPLDEEQAAGMLAETRISRLLDGYRDVPATRTDEIVDVLLALSDLISLMPDVAELDINPLLADAQGVIALDARIILHPETPGA